MSDSVVGILGGGQLGRMLVASASLLNIDVVILDVGVHAPAKQIASPRNAELSHIDGSFADAEKIIELAKKVDVITVEIEHVNVDSLVEVQRQIPSIIIHPSPSTIRTIQDKFLQKQHLSSHGLPLAPYIQVEPTASSIEQAIEKFGLPLMLKSRTLAYDGRGNFAIKSKSQIEEALAALKDRPLYAEKWVPFAKETAVMVVRSANSETRSYPVVETIHKENICHLVFAPLRGQNPSIFSRAQKIAEEAVASFEGAGVFGVEMFLLENGDIYVNEIAPRPHNSGHYTIEACETSQYENHLRAILSLPLGSTHLKVPSAVMLNIIGASSSMEEIKKVARAALFVPGASTHLYGKADCRKGRKMGHITVVGESDAQIRKRLRPLLEALPSGTTSPEELDLYSPQPSVGHSHAQPLVGIIMGSDSDLPVMLAAARFMDQFKVPYELTIVSAHRTPDRLVQYARSAAARGLRVIIAGAGGAAHLPGMVASMTPLPVIGVPVKGTHLDGVDSLHSIVQMPRGIPVATVAINNATNAGLLAIRILGTGIPHLSQATSNYAASLDQEVHAKIDRLANEGWYDYQVKK